MDLGILEKMIKSKTKVDTLPIDQSLSSRSSFQVEAGATVYLRVTPRYTESGLRPYAFDYHMVIDGKQLAPAMFSNMPGAYP